MRKIVQIDGNDFALCIADRVAQLAKEMIEQHGAFYLSLSGGSTPKAIYQVLAEHFRDKLDWTKVYLFFGDERYVPHQHEDSNYKMASDALLKWVPIPAENIFPFDTSFDQPADSAKAYQSVMMEKLPIGNNGIPVFDLVLLGMGADGHTASLFPDTNILDSSEYVESVFVEKMDSMRLTITFPIINQAKQVWVIIAGAEKKSVLQAVLNGDEDHGYPIERVSPAGELTWLLDSKAAEGINI